MVHYGHRKRTWSKSDDNNIIKEITTFLFIYEPHTLLGYRHVGSSMSPAAFEPIVQQAPTTDALLANVFFYEITISILLNSFKARDVLASYTVSSAKSIPIKNCHSRIT